jgi:outer membrane protein assembly factor BamB
MRLFRGRAWRGALVAGSLLVLAGCSLFSHDDDRYKPVPLTNYPAGLSVRVAWRAPVGSGSGVGFAPALVGDTAYAATPDGSVAKVDLTTGNIVWRSSAETKLTAGAGSDGTTTAVASPSGQVIAFDDTGKIKWKAQATSDVYVPPAVGAGIVAVRSGDYRIQAFDANTGERLWNVQRPGPALSLRSTSQMVVSDNLVITGLPGGKMMALAARNGNIQWEGSVATPKGATDLERLSDVVGKPAFNGRAMCAVAYQGRIACFDISEGGRLAWGKDFSSITGLAMDGRNVYAPDQHGVVSAFAIDGGALAWKQDAIRNRDLSAPAAYGEAVALGDLEGYVHFLSAADGHLLARLSVGGGAILSPLLSTKQGVLVQTGDGALVLIAVN